MCFRVCYTPSNGRCGIVRISRISPQLSYKERVYLVHQAYHWCHCTALLRIIWSPRIWLWHHWGPRRGPRNHREVTVLNLHLDRCARRARHVQRLYDLSQNLRKTIDTISPEHLQEGEKLGRTPQAKVINIYLDLIVVKIVRNVDVVRSFLLHSKLAM